MMKKTFQPHKKPTGTSSPCSPQHLILVNEGVQCSNCLVLVVKNEWVEDKPKPKPKPKPKRIPDCMDYEPHPFSGENFD